MAIGRNARTLYKLCSCGKVSRSDTFKKHRVGDTHTHKAVASKHYCAACDVFKFTSVKLKDWQSIHADCKSVCATIAVLEKIFSTEIAQISEVGTAINSISETSLKSDLSLSSDDSDQESEITESDEKENKDIDYENLKTQDVESEITESDEKENKDIDNENLKTQDVETLLDKTENDNDVSIENVDLDKTPPPIKKQYDLFVPHPTLPKNMEQLRIEISRMKDRHYMDVAKNESMQKELDMLRNKRTLYENSINQNIDLKSQIEKLTKEMTSIKSQLMKYKLKDDENNEITHKLKIAEDQLKTIGRVSHSMIHLPLRANELLADPMVNEVGAPHSCYNREKKGIKCHHVVVAHQGRLESVKMWHTATKKRIPSALCEGEAKRQF